MTEPRRTSAVVLAAGAGTRFGGGKLRAALGGRPILQHVLDAVAAAGLDDVVVVVGDDAPEVEAAIHWRSERRVRNPEPSRGLSSSVRLGLEATGAAEHVVFVLGDQPGLTSTTIRAVLDAAAATDRPFVVPRFAEDAARNPVVVASAGRTLVDELAGDRGFGPILAAHPELVEEVAVPGSNPDVDTRADLVAAAAARWAARVRSDHEQVDRFREVPDGADFYAPVRSIFRADPDRTDDPTADALRALARPRETWLDIGAGAGRFALPLARVVGRVIALDTSPSMLGALREDAASHGIENVTTIVGAWPPSPGSDLAGELGPFPVADVALIAHVGYDIAAIVPFVEAMEAAARRLCVAVLMEARPGSLADPLWPAVHGEARVELPGLNDLVELLQLRGHAPTLQHLPHEPRRFPSREDLLRLARRQLWTEPGGEKDRRLQAALDDHVETEADGSVRFRVQTPGRVGIVTWR